MLKKLYIIEKGSNVPFFLVNAKDLEGYTTTEKDMKKNVSRFPPKELLCAEENLLKEGEVNDNSPTQPQDMDYNQRYERSSTNDENSDVDTDITSNMSMGAKNLFSRN